MATPPPHPPPPPLPSPFADLLTRHGVPPSLAFAGAVTHQADGAPVRTLPRYIRLRPCLQCAHLEALELIVTAGQKCVPSESASRLAPLRAQLAGLRGRCEARSALSLLGPISLCSCASCVADPPRRDVCYPLASDLETRVLADVAEILGEADAARCGRLRPMVLGALDCPSQPVPYGRATTDDTPDACTLDLDRALSTLAGRGITPVSYLPHFWRIGDPDFQLAQTALHRAGLVSGIDAASGLAAYTLLAPPANGHVLDICAAPGAKTGLIMDAMTRRRALGRAALDLLGRLEGGDAEGRLGQGAASVTAVDLCPTRLRTACGQLKRQGLHPPAAPDVPPFRAYSRCGVSFDAFAPSPEVPFDSAHPRRPSRLYLTAHPDLRACAHDSQIPYDRVIVDAECTTDGSVKHLFRSGAGAQHAVGGASLEARLSEDALCQLNDLQYRLLENGFRLLAPGGCLVYATCSWLARQNEDVVLRLLEAYPDSARTIDLSTHPEPTSQAAANPWAGVLKQFEDHQPSGPGHGVLEALRTLDFGAQSLPVPDSASAPAPMQMCGLSAECPGHQSHPAGSPGLGPPVCGPPGLEAPQLPLGVIHSRRLRGALRMSPAGTRTACLFMVRLTKLPAAARSSASALPPPVANCGHSPTRKRQRIQVNHVDM
ncbi:hypothetical protein H696_01695 [Fonticula alba]|uniref:SAM-dependent MTase RsmB/NOP-type domain-containing protein n=1 Tax=Fonticula alba TaxID=691883 RepID=A0A058ZEE8_FONAL|nr:hypothetical protein H696_01695 [Fonticula alba]KCV72298.1 hypothetical protein H696_01695 [Fonticula alba]|eukprot:XP_009493876.1 hypothetical protein H696_01695 [Fonticula alba]